MGETGLGMIIARELISSQAKGALALVLSHIAHEIKLAWGFKKNLKDLQTHMIRLNELLNGAELSCSASVPSPVNMLLKQWLNAVKDAAFDADDLLDNYSYKALEQRSVLQARRTPASAVCRAKRLVKTKIVGIKRVGFRCQMAHKVRELRQSIEGIYKTANELGIRPVKVAAGSASGHGHDDEIRIAKWLRDQREWVDDKGLVGREKDFESIVKLLCDSNNCCRDLTVIGIVGLGKTSLCKLVSNSKQVKEYFGEQIIWVVVAYSFDLTSLFNKMVENLGGKGSNMSDSHAIVKHLKKKLNSSKYLLILDDVWGTLNWESLKNCLKEIGGSKGSTILATSREKNTVTMMETDRYDNNGRRTVTKPFVYELKGLNEVDSMFLFEQRAADNEALAADPEKKEIGSRMLHKCGGVPLAIRALGDLLRDKSIGKWKEIEESEIWDKDYKHDILPSLQLSFHYLPGVAVKRCFSYCAIFPEDAIIEKEQLIQMWMAQGLLHPHDEMEVIGDKYFHILLNSSFFQEVYVDILGNVMTCKMHDLVWYLAQVISEGECLDFAKQINKGNDSSNEVRHVSIVSHHDKLKASSYPKLRTICYHKHHRLTGLSPQFLSEFKRLRVLSLQNLCLTDLPDSMSNLKHLRYLNLSGNGFMEVPNMITKLFHLQTLRIVGNQVAYSIRFPILPKQVSNLVHLRHIYTDEVSNSDGVGIPKGMGHLTALQTMPTIDLGIDWGGKVRELGSLNNLNGALKLKSVECLQSKEEAKSLNLGRKSNLDHLSLEWSPGGDDSRQNEVFEALQPADRITTLHVRRYTDTRFPQWLTNMTELGGSLLSNLMSLTISRCYYAKGDLNLKNLSSLRFLSLKYCYELDISFPNDGFQCCKLLEKLEISQCSKVKTLPDISPLSHLHELKVDGNGITSHVVGLANLTSLSKLWIDHLPKDLDESAPLCRCLLTLTLTTNSCSKPLPDQLQHLVKLEELRICGFETEESLPEWLQNLTSLQMLTLKDMPQLRFMPSQQAMERLAKLRIMHIIHCPLLSEQCNQGNGSEWFKIAHLPFIKLF